MNEVMKWVTNSVVVHHMLCYQLYSVWGRVVEADEVEHEVLFP